MCNMKNKVILAATCLVLFLGSYSEVYSERMVWEQTLIEKVANVGDLQIDAVFRFSVQDKPVTIQSIRSSCGCTTASLSKKRFEPGETGEIEVHFKLGARVGAQKKYIMLQVDDPEHPSVELELQVYIPHVIRLEPRFVYWTKGSAEYEPQTLSVKVDVDVPISIQSISTDQEQLKVNWVKTDEKEFEVILQPQISEGEIPFFRSVIKIEIKADIPLKQTVFYAYAFMKS